MKKEQDELREKKTKAKESDEQPEVDLNYLHSVVEEEDSGSDLEVKGGSDSDEEKEGTLNIDSSDSDEEPPSRRSTRAKQSKETSQPLNGHFKNRKGDTKRPLAKSLKQTEKRQKILNR